MGACVYSPGVEILDRHRTGERIGVWRLDSRLQLLQPYEGNYGLNHLKYAF